jgi:choline dehydrogenase
LSWDYIIIGAGSAGCALAHELAISRPHESVLVLEAGSADRAPSIRLQFTIYRAMALHDWGYESLPDASRNGTREKWVRGRVLGGTSSINSGIFVRGAAHDFDRWASHCGPQNTADWSAQAVMPIFRDLERSDQASPLRGRSGPLHVRTVKRAHPLTAAFIESACDAGHPFNPDYNGQIQEGVAYVQLTQRRSGLRCSAADAFLKPLLGRRNLKLLLNSLVEKIEFDKGRASAVCFRHRGQRRREKAREIVLCAGSINSPKLLMLSGIGAAEELKRHGIGVVVDLPGVGGNLMEHALAITVHRSRIEAYNLTGGLRQMARFATQYVIHREGPISNVFEGIAFLRTSPSKPYPDVQMHAVPAAWTVTAENKIAFPPYPALSVYVNVSHTKSRGRIHLASGDPQDAPLIDYPMFGEEADLDTLAHGVAMVRNIMNTGPIAGLVEEECMPGPRVESLAALKEHIRAHSQIANHSIGTCRMGSDADAVVGPDLRVRGVENLWIADASIMPHHISGNTSATCMMIGKKLGMQLSTRRV